MRTSLLGLVILFILTAALIAAPPAPVVATDRNIPLFFIPNQGQAPSDVRYMAKGSGLTAYFYQDEVSYRASGSPVTMRFAGAGHAARIEGSSPLSGKVNFFTGPKEQWRTGLPIYSTLEYHGLYPGVDMSYGLAGRDLKSEFIVAPGSDPSVIRIRYESAGAVRLDSEGSLLIPTAKGTLRELPPVAWQLRGGVKTPVEARFVVDSDGTVRFALGDYDRHLALTIDPVIAYSTFLGGASADAANAIAVDGSGSAYITGFTESFDLPTINALQGANGGGNDAFVAKLSASGNSLVYCTYLGGKGDDRGFGIAVDSTGAAYITGSTQSANFPTHSAYQSNLAGGKNAFVAKLSSAGNSLVYSTYLGGSQTDVGYGIAVDGSGNAYVVGDTTSTNFPANGYQHSSKGGQTAFVAKMTAAGGLGYATYLGGGTSDHGAAIAVDAAGEAYVTGSTSSPDFPVLNALQPASGGGQDAFVAKLNAAGSALLFSTYLGGSGGSVGLTESGEGIAVDSSGNAYIAGVTSSANFPLLNPAQSTLNGPSDAFVAKLSSTGALRYSTYLGGSGMDWANAITIDSSGTAYIAGYTYSADFPVVATSQTAPAGGITDAFAAKLNSTGSAFLFATYLGGNDSDTATGVAVDASGSMYVAGWTLSPNFPTVNAYQTQNVGDYGAFVTKYTFSAAPANVSVSPASGSGSSGVFTFQYSDGNGNADLTLVAASFGSNPTNQAGSCTVLYNHTANALLLLTDAGAQPATGITPGSGTAQNSQCILNGGASSVSAAGNNLSLTLSLTFQPAFGGTKTIYMDASSAQQTTSWQSEGSWTIPASIAMSVSPSAGTATQQTFAFTFTDSSGAGDLTTVSGLFAGSSSSLASACMVTYSVANNSLALATDAGAAPSSAIRPGAGSAQNSQCILNGANSSVAVLGNSIVMNVALTFQPSFGGAKNIYAGATTQAISIPWAQEGSWSSAPGLSMSVSPSSGNGLTQTFAVQVTDTAGSADLSSVGLLVNTAANSPAACAVIYNRAQNTLSLLTDAGGTPASAITPGSGQAQNSQCTLNGAGSSVTAAGNTLTINLALTFQPVFSGSKNLYVQAANSFQFVDWTQEGAWSVPGVINFSVSPNSGGSLQQKFTFQFTDSIGATDITTAGVLINSSANPAHACSFTYNRAQNTLALLTDAGTAPATPVTLGSGTTANSQCTIVSSSSSATTLGNTLTLSVQINFLPQFGGTKVIYMDAANATQTVSWTAEGTWSTVATISMAASPTSGTGNVATLSAQVTDSLGASDLTTVGLLINSTASTTAGCVVIYNSAQNSLALLTDSGAMPSSTISPGNGIAQNSQCTLNGSASSVTTQGNTLSVNLALSFQPIFSGAKNVYVECANAFQTVSWLIEGTWTSPPPPPLTLSLAPASGAGTQQVFTAQAADTLGGADISTLEIMIGANTTGANSCAVVYNRAQNTLALLTDAGSAPASTIIPGGSGTQSNSQCQLSASGSSAAISGNVLTLNAAITFLPAFAGTRNTYVEASNPFQAAVWTPEGTWTASVALTTSVTPSTGSGTQQVFNVFATDPLGATDLSVVGILINATTDLPNSCAVIYNRLQNTLALLTDAGAMPATSIIPGSGTQTNSQCTLNGSASSITGSGNTLIASIALAFQPGFSGSKNIYTEAGSAVVPAAWTQTGSWTAPPTLTMTLNPASGMGSQQVFSAQVTDVLGATDLSTVGILINSTASASGACAVIYNRAPNTFALLTDSGAVPASGLTPGASGTQSNSQCTLIASSSGASASGNTLTVNASVSFATAFAGNKNTYVEATNLFQSASWTQAGTWTASVPLTSSVTPASGSGTAQVFALQVGDPLGTSDLNFVELAVNSTSSVTNACAVIYNRAQNTLALLTDAGAPPASTITPGSGTQSNSQCTLSGVGSTVSASGNTLTVNLSLAFLPAFSGAKNTYTQAAGALTSMPLTQSGTWTSPPPVTMSVTPAAGAGNQQTFTLQMTDALGATDISTAGILINSTATSSGACAVIYNRAQNTLALLTDAGSPPATTIAPGSGTQSNSQCTLSGAGSTVNASGNTLTVNVALTLLPAFYGSRNIYAELANPYQSAVWTQEGTWTAMTTGISVVSMTPSSGSGGSQIFTAQFTDSRGISDLTTASILINSAASSAAGCMVTYNVVQGSLALLSDAGAVSGIIAPGSGSLSNSQCVLSGPSSSASVSGNVLTLKVAIGFKASFNGQKTVYGSGTSAGGSNLAPQASGSWTVAVTSQAPQATSAAPTSGSGMSQTFTFVYNDVNGASDLSSAQVIINATNSTTGSCYVWVTPGLNTIWLASDTGAWSIAQTLGVAGTLQNSQCSINIGASSGTTSGNTFTMNLAVNFKTAFIGSKNIYSYASNLGGLFSGWQTLGTFTVAKIAPTLAVVSVAPATGTGGSQAFTLQFSDSLGAADLGSVSMLINSSSSTTGACAVSYNVAQNTLSLLSDTGAASGAIALGSGALSNSQCVLTGSASSVSFSGNTLTLTAAVGFKSAFSGQKAVYGNASSSDGTTTTGWKPVGAWTVASASQAPQAASVSPASGTGLSQTFTFVYTDINGASDLASAQAIIGSGASSTGSCYVWVTPGVNSIWLASDVGAWPAAQTLGTAGTLQNSQCSISTGASSGTLSGTTFTLKLAITFAASFTGSKNVFSYASNLGGLVSGWQTVGTWTPAVGGQGNQQLNNLIRVLKRR
jgi:hypothetical protein